MTEQSINKDHINSKALMGKPAFYAYTTPQESKRPWEQRSAIIPGQNLGRLKCGQRANGDVLARIAAQQRTGASKKEWSLEFADTFPLKSDRMSPNNTKLYKNDDDWKKFVSQKVGFQHAHVKYKNENDKSGDEWYELTNTELRGLWLEFKYGIPYEAGRTKNHSLRPEQEQSIESALRWYMDHLESAFAEEQCFLWNAKMRFGKCFSTYKLADQLSAKLKQHGKKQGKGIRLLVLTHKPSAFDSWETDLAEHTDFTGWKLIKADTPKADEKKWLADPEANVISLISFQKLNSNKKRDRADIDFLWTSGEWDIVAMDEYHFGAWNASSKKHLSGWAEVFDDTEEEKSEDKNKKETKPPELVDEVDEDEIFQTVDPDYLKNRGIQTHFYLYLSGTPFRSLESGELQPEQIFTWTYADEQKAKRKWDTEIKSGRKAKGSNIYAELPEMYLLTYNIPPEAKEMAQDSDGWFNLNAFFKAKQDSSGNYIFAHADMVHRFLDYLTGEASLRMEGAGDDEPELPFKDEGMIAELAHTFWLFKEKASVFAMKSLMEKHNFFRNFEILPIAGNEVPAGQAALRVKAAIARVENQGSKKGTITLSCGKLATGSTVKEWTGIFMLTNANTPETYFQTSFRAGTPWFNIDSITKEQQIIKTRFWVFDFAPQRTLQKVYQLAQLQTPNRSQVGNLVVDDDVATMEELAGLMSIYCYDGGTFSQLDGEEILTITTKGTTQSMMVRKWRAKNLVNLNLQQLIKIQNGNPEVIVIVNKIIQHRRAKNSLDAYDVFRRVINSEESVRTKKSKKGKLTNSEKKENTEAKKQLAEIKEKLAVFIQRIPLFMYITDDREKKLMEVIQTTEGNLFEKATGLTVKDFSRLNEIGVFPPNNMNALIWSFKNFEDGSYDHLGATGQPTTSTYAGWDTLINKEDYKDSNRLG